jgi:hypothetical protein
MPIKRKLPKHVEEVTVRRDGQRWGYFYFRHKGSPRIRLPDHPWSPEFMAAYSNALAIAGSLRSSALRSALPGGIVAKRGVDPNTVQPLIGVYLLMLKGRIVYIGSSLNMPNRVSNHRSNGRPFDQVYYIATRANERERLEATLIRAINPSQNRMHRSATIEVNGNSDALGEKHDIHDRA